ncbi:MAG: hypothetical protein QME81_02310 [bacterium]|nr:hypothetical protein [bacterium]
MNIFKETAKFIGWLSGSLAGVGAILLACGYLVTQANLHLLGLDVLLFQYDNKYYLQRGASFILYAANLIIEILIPLACVFLTILAFLVIFYLVLTRTRLNKYFESCKFKLANLNEKLRWLHRTLIFIVLAFLFFVHLLPGLDLLKKPLEISDLLYNTSHLTPSTENNKIKERLANGQTVELRNHFLLVLISVIEAGILLLLAWRVTSIWHLQFLMVSPFAIIFILYIILLPMVYGVLIIPIEFAPIEIKCGDKMLSNKSGTLDRFRLLNKTDQEFVLWDSTEKKVFWIPKEQVESAVIRERRPLFPGRTDGK